MLAQIPRTSAAAVALLLSVPTMRAQAGKAAAWLRFGTGA
jgi:hypothetical protein